ncbi:MAG: hypothetical protein GEV03_21330 [Streptosporangiales bacterium]|nr:hypothetical protein [Streptosporangiales bacterium]
MEDSNETDRAFSATAPSAARDRARAAQETKARVLADLPEDMRADELANVPEFGEEHTPSATDPANAPVGRGTEWPTRARIAWVRQVQ